MLSLLPFPTKENPSNLNQRWTWNASDNTVRSRMSGLCLDGGTLTDCFHPPFDAFPWCNTSLDFLVRATLLVANMTLGEKTSNLQNSNAGVTRLAAPPNRFSEALHGVLVGCGTPSGPQSTGCPTSFPHALALGATFNRYSHFSISFSLCFLEIGACAHNIAFLFQYLPSFITVMLLVRSGDPSAPLYPQRPELWTTKASLGFSFGLYVELEGRKGYRGVFHSARHITFISMCVCVYVSK